jgi:hypothetical protein
VSGERGLWCLLKGSSSSSTVRSEAGSSVIVSQKDFRCTARWRDGSGYKLNIASGDDGLDTKRRVVIFGSVPLTVLSSAHDERVFI